MILRSLMTVRSLALAISTLALAATSPVAFDLDSLFIQSVGGREGYETLQRMENYRVEGRVMINGMPGHTEIIYAVPDLIYVSIEMPQFSIVQAFDGETAWQKGMTGNVTELTGFERDELLKQIYLQSYAYLFNDRVPGGEQYLGLKEIDGVTYHEVLMTPLHQDSVRIYFDTATGLPELSISRLDNIETRSVVEDYQVFDGVPVAMYSKVTATGVPITTEMFFESVEFNAPIDPTIFSRASVATPPAKFPPDAEYVRVPFEYRNGHIWVTAVVNGKLTAQFLLDSGASATMMDSAATESLSLKRVGSLPARGAAGFHKVALVKTQTLQIGDVGLPGQVAGRTDLSGLVTVPEGETFGGILGYDFLSRFPLYVDFDHNELRIYNPASFTPPDSGHEIPFTLTMLVPTIEAELQGVPGQFVVDLGNAIGLIVHPRFVEEHGLDSAFTNIEDLRTVMGGVGGGVSGRAAEINSLQIGDIHIDKLRIVLPDANTGLSGSREIAGNIGTPVLRAFNLLFDYENNRIIFYRSEP